MEKVISTMFTSSSPIKCKTFLIENLDILDEFVFFSQSHLFLKKD